MMIKQGIKFRTPNTRNQTPNRNGVALLVVLLVVMTITILSLGFLSRSDVELACGQNMVLKTQVDYLAESGLEHARGLILNPQDISSEYWTGATSQQLVAGSDDYYDVNVVKLDECNYQITCEAYREKGVEKIGRGSIMVELRLDPCIALWTGDDTTIWNGVTINGDVHCDDVLTNEGSIHGDVFADDLNGNIDGREYDVSELSLAWPDISVDDFQGRASQYESGDYTISLDSEINGMLLVGGDLTIRNGVNVDIEADKNLPALYVNGDLIIEQYANLQVDGLAVVNGSILINGDADVDILGGLFTRNSFSETAVDSSGNNSYGILCNGPSWQPGAGGIIGALRFDGTNDYIRVENESLFDITSQITVAAWIKVNAFNRSFQAIVTKGDSSWRIQRWSNTNRIEFACTGLSHSIPYGSLTGNINVNDGMWHHVAGVYDGSRIYLYIDGNLDISEPSSGSISTNNYKVLIGANAQQSGRYWNGWIDDVQVYNCGLDVNDINIVRVGGTVSGLIGHWRFDESGADVDITAAPEKTAILVGAVGDEEKWGQAAGAFFRSIERR